jgi:hypothetical protein
MSATEQFKSVRLNSAHFNSTENLISTPYSLRICAEKYFINSSVNTSICFIDIITLWPTWLSAGSRPSQHRACVQTAVSVAKENTINHLADDGRTTRTMYLIFYDAIRYITVSTRQSAHSIQIMRTSRTKHGVCSLGVDGIGWMLVMWSLLVVAGPFIAFILTVAWSRTQRLLT